MLESRGHECVVNGCKATLTTDSRGHKINCAISTEKLNLAILEQPVLGAEKSPVRAECGFMLVMSYEPLFDIPTNGWQRSQAPG